MSILANDPSLREAPRVTAPAGTPFNAADELHPSWCDSLDRDTPAGCGAHGSTTAYIVLTSNAYEVTDQGAAFPLLMVCGVVDTEQGEPYRLVVEVTLQGPDRQAALRFTPAEAVQLATLLRRVEAGSVAATGGDPYGAVAAMVLRSGWLSLSGALSMVLNPSEAGLLCEALRDCAALPMDREAFATWAEHRARAEAAGS